MIGQLLLIASVLMFVYMTGWFLVAKKRNQLNVVDVAWGGGFILVAWSLYAIYQVPRNLLVAMLVTLWGLRLMGHLFKRVRQGHDDPRYDAMKTKWGRHVWLRAYFWVFMLQGVLILLISAPLFVSADKAIDSLAWLIYVGAGIWFVGFTVERIADAQLADFVNDAKNKGKVMDKGLWKYSRHPNYFGELLEWWGIGIIALQAQYGWIGLIGPLTLTILILFVSGIPPIENRKKSNPAYADYMRRTSVLVPLPPKS